MSCAISRITFLFLVLLRLSAFGQVMIDATHEFTDSKFPILIINTNGQTIVDTPRRIAHLGVIWNKSGARNQLSDSYNHYDGQIAIELRGSSSAQYPKKQYRIETQNPDGSNLNVSLLGMPSENDWILYGPYNDQSLLRNVLMYELSNQIGRYAVRTRYCELIINNEYKGLYILMEKIKQDKNRVNIAKLDSDDITGDSLTGGYILKIDKLEGENNSGFYSYGGIVYQYHYPKPADIQSEQKVYIENYTNQFEKCMISSSYNASVTGYSSIIDVSSFVDHFILNEFSRNVDAYRISAYLFKNRDDKNGLLNAGPIWDMNLSLGKSFFDIDFYKVEDWSVDYYLDHSWDSYQVPFWWVKLSDDPLFMHQVYLRWIDLRQKQLDLDCFFNVIDQHAEKIKEARIRNFQRWPEVEYGHNYEREIRDLKDWIEDRVEWIDNELLQYADSTIDENSGYLPQSIQLLPNYPNPFNSSTTIGYELRSPSSVQLSIFTLTGCRIFELSYPNQAKGQHFIQWNGMDQDGLFVPSGVYLYTLEGFNRKISGRMVLIK